MSAAAPAPPAKGEQFYTLVESLRSFDEHEVQGVIRSLLAPTDHEKCYIATYSRATANIESVLKLNESRHFQALAMLARGLFELAVDMRLLEVLPNGWVQMLAFVDDEKLRCARKIVDYKNDYPNADVDLGPYTSFIAARGNQIDDKHRLLWPDKKNPTKLKGIGHWSGLRTGERILSVGEPFKQIYEVHYPRLSWYVHSGLTGVVNLKAETLANTSVMAFKLAADSYWEILKSVILKFRIEKANEKIFRQLKVAKLLPFADSPELVDALMQSIR